MFRVHTLNVLAPAQVLNFNIPSTTGHPKTNHDVKNKTIHLSIMHNDTRFGMYLFSVGTHLGNLPVSIGSQQWILISASVVSRCGSPVWKSGSCTLHRPVERAL